MRIWAGIFLIAWNPNASLATTSSGSKLSVIRSRSSPASLLEPNFQGRVKTSRRFVFENIMDLDHVCSLHKRWFRNLRIVAQKPDYVEYHLTSLFYGLKQETTARGGPVDENCYWYEFITPFAKMRVDGLMEGRDGDL